MKNNSKQSNTNSVPSQNSRISASDYLRRLGETFSASERRFFSRREGADLVAALRSALVSPSRLLAQDAVTQECYRYLTIVNRTPVSGLSLISFSGKDLARQVTLSARLQAVASALTDALRSGSMAPDDEIPEYDLNLYSQYVELLSFSSRHFDVDMDALGKVLTPTSTYHSLRDFILEQLNANYNVPESFIEAFILAHAYLYRLSLLD